MITHKLRQAFLMLSIAVLMLGLSLAVAVAQEEDNDGNGTSTGYHVSEENDKDTPIERDSGENGPIRLARILTVKGDVTWRPDAEGEWSKATINLPLKQGAQLFVSDGARAELLFDDGSILRLGSGSVVTLQSLHSDAEGAFTNIRLSEGLLSLRLKHKLSVYQIDTPLVSVKSTGPGKVRVGAKDTVEVAVREGRAHVEGRSGDTTLENGDYLEIRHAEDAFEVGRLPEPDNWDRYTEKRDRELEERNSSPSMQNLPPNISLSAPELDDYGSWRSVPRYGTVWFPRVTAVQWRPYMNGQWTWVTPFGWTWVSNEPWGWAPYHYGTWVATGYGWAWVPGPVNQYWSPGVVHFIETDGDVAWVPLAPGEVIYPRSLTCGQISNWSLYFSIAGAAVYYPTANNVCVARPWEPHYVNVTNITNITNVNNNSLTVIDRSSFSRFRNSYEFGASTNNTYLHTRNFVPKNAGTAHGMTYTSRESFGGKGVYHPVNMNAADILARGRGVGAPPADKMPSAGPVGVRASIEATRPARTYTREVTPQADQLSRPVYRMRLPETVRREQTTVQRPASQSTSERLNTLARPFETVRRQQSSGATNNPGAFNSDRSTEGSNSNSGVGRRQSGSSQGSSGERLRMPDTNRGTNGQADRYSGRNSSTDRNPGDSSTTRRRQYDQNTGKDNPLINTDRRTRPGSGNGAGSDNNRNSGSRFGGSQEGRSYGRQGQPGNGMNGSDMGGGRSGSYPGGMRGQNPSAPSRPLPPVIQNMRNTPPPPQVVRPTPTPPPVVKPTPPPPPPPANPPKKQ